MKKNLGYVCLCAIMSITVLTGCGSSSGENQGEATPTSESTHVPIEYTNEEQILHTLMDNGFEFFYELTGKDFTETNEVNKQEYCNEMVAIYELLGADVSGYSSETFLAEFNKLCEKENSEDIFSLAGEQLGIEYEEYVTIYEEYLKFSTLQQYFFGGYLDAKKEQWQNATSDEKRIAAAGDVINCFIGIGYEITITPQELSSKINEFYSNGNEDVSVVDAALNYLPKEIDGESTKKLWEKYYILDLEF